MAPTKEVVRVVGRARGDGAVGTRGWHGTGQHVIPVLTTCESHTFGSGRHGIKSSVNRIYHSNPS
jgi:hypothetical protein